MPRDDAVNILLVDDQPGKLLSYQVMLEELGETLLPVSSAQEALAILLKTEVAVVLIDVCMPELDGFELARMIREHPRFQKIAIIFISAIHISESDYLKGYEAGAVDYMSVPVVPELLRAKVRVFVELFRKNGQLQQLNEDLEHRVSERTEALERSSAQLRRSEQGRELALAAGNMGFWDWDVSTDEWQWDEGQRRIFAVGREAEVRGIEAMRTAIHPNDRDRLDAGLAGLSEDTKSFEFECRIRRPDGSQRWCRQVAAGIFDGSGKLVRISGVTTDITEHKEAEAKQLLLAREVDHRARNALAVVQAIVRLARRDTVHDFIEGVEGRINALAKTHELLSQARWKGADILRLVLDELSPYQAEKNTKVTAIGRSMLLSPENAQIMAIALHELATNAAKHGSLSSADGRLDVSWGVLKESLRLKWTESGGPPVKRPEVGGFGTKIIAASFGNSDRGSVEFDWRPEGLSCVLTLTVTPEAEQIGLGDNLIINGPGSGAPSRNILLVEDEALVGLLLQEMLQDMGYSVGDACPSLDDAFSAIAGREFDGAILDINLGGKSVYPLADVLVARNIPFVFVTGYAQEAVDRKYANVPILQKPIMREDLDRLLGSWIAPPATVVPLILKRA